MNTLRNFAKFVLVVFSQNPRKNYVNGIFRLRVFKMIYKMFIFQKFEFFGHPLRSHWESFRDLLIISRNQHIFEKFKLNQNLQTIPFKMMYNMSMLRHRFSDERGGGGDGEVPWTTFLSYSVKVCTYSNHSAKTDLGNQCFCMEDSRVIH